ncbi:Glyoxalase/Bleomycin resistance protein/Dihydroxybiphenyl dioxygenase [Penicillium cataractarum]|uniref:Glyoxalase/Bleomycin resistance protein/Dihydroxybiphenyl dioxygenase n=1 Tax=Penicillium cataractarum TaxID=2100454 RepID=A0A9W9RF29_9EURO|nr:Glyoxalase/Bleomycin resistance protein/Dihydroxybiphenyl dioxygenase [Penicillium cataractarum]KAJ5359045.1 Glyoxalase/Bleomycin resistance protein/Dihydroxybiphenyl dioxygenase [Penicillium cataractarum]
MSDLSILRPSGLAHVVFRTANIKVMVEFWSRFLGAERVFENDFIAFLRYDDEHHRVAIINDAGTGPHSATAAGLHHVAFTYGTLQGLLKAWELREKLGIKPTWCVNHGPTTSVYYKDPDGNAIETQVDNFDTVEEANEFMTSKFFQENPIGTDIDPNELLRQLEAGAAEKALKRRVEIGIRHDIPAAV